ncbi:hypothetical protein KDA23_03210 [Candidatus Saccharibacteria bacterium]|nr:hypothetical protein [Candidatus Saccharibacteria bacterium]
MDEGPFRMSSRPERTEPDKPEPQSKPAEEPKQTTVKKPVEKIVEKPKPMQRSLGSRRLGETKSFKKPLIFGGAAVVGVVVLVSLVWALIAGLSGNSNGIDSKKYQAVFFTNGQVYFGKLQQVNDEYMKLTDIYYLQTQSSNTEDSKNPQETSSEGSPTLIKLGSEIHGPEDEMIISKEQVLFYENLKTDGKVAQSIEKYKSPN